MKKLLATILIALLAMSCLLAFVGCNSNDEEYGDTFVGAISQSTFESVEDAVKGFLEEEISGQAFVAEYVGYTKTADLSKDEIDVLKIDEEIKKDIVSVERGEVEYIEQFNKESELLTKLASETCKRIVYIVRYVKNGEKLYRFYIPVAVEGETLTYSEYKNIFDIDKFMNFTANFKFFDREEIKLKVVDNTIQQGDWIYIIYKAPYLCEVFLGDEYCDTYVQNAEEMTMRQAMEDLFEEIEYMGELTVLSIVYQFVNGSAYSPGAYVKTKTGFALRDEFKEEKDDSLLITIANGRVANIDLTVGFWDVGSYKVWNLSYSFYDFGTTKVDIPTDVMDAVNAYVVEN